MISSPDMLQASQDQRTSTAREAITSTPSPLPIAASPTNEPAQQSGAASSAPLSTVQLSTQAVTSSQTSSLTPALLNYTSSSVAATAAGPQTTLMRSEPGSSRLTSASAASNTSSVDQTTLQALVATSLPSVTPDSSSDHSSTLPPSAAPTPQTGDSTTNLTSVATTQSSLLAISTETSGNSLASSSNPAIYSSTSIGLAEQRQTGVSRGCRANGRCFGEYIVCTFGRVPIRPKIFYALLLRVVVTVAPLCPL